MSSDKNPKRALPYWMSARDDGNGDKQVDDTPDVNNQVETSNKTVRGRGKEPKDNGEASERKKKLEFSKLLEGVVFVLSGFVNPERGMLRSQALEMGAEYQPDWNSNCTLLVCAFPNTPKFRQVEADGGTIVSKNWITECYTQKKLLDIETYLMHIGKPWRKNNITHTGNEVCETPQPNKKSHKKEVKGPEVEPNAFYSAKELTGNTSICFKDKFPASKVKKWALDDFNRTLTWLESQEEKPEPSEIRSVAAEGILTCLQDTIDLLENEQDLQNLTEQWNMVPHVVEELIGLQSIDTPSSISKDGLHKQALLCKKVYEGELKGMVSSGSNEKNRDPKCKSRNTGKGKHSSTDEFVRHPNLKKKSHKEEVKGPEVEPNAFYSAKELTGNTSICFKDKFPASKVEKWAFDDFNRTLTWLESQEEKPEPSEIRSVAAEGILTCLQDTIDLLESEQDLQNLTAQWNMVPHVVEELIGLQSTDTSSSISKDGLHKQALLCKKIYEGELNGMVSSGSNEKNEEPKCKSCNTGKGKHSSTDEVGCNLKDYDSDETIEMTEEEINDAYNSLVSKLPSSS